MASHQQRMQMMQQQQQMQRQREQARYSQQRPSAGSQQSHGYHQQQQQQQPPHPQQYHQQSQPRYQQNPQQQQPPTYQQHPRTTPNASINSYPNSNTPSQSGSLQQQGGYRQQQPLSNSNPVLYQHQQPSHTAPVPYRHPSGHSGYNSRTGSMGPRSYHGSRTSMGSHTGPRQASRSLGASKASLATYRSGKSSIQQEYHDRMVHSRLSAIHLGKARTPFLIAIFLFVSGFLVFIVGVVITVLRYYGNIFIGVDNVDAIGPIILVIGLVLCAIGIKFIYDAYQISETERRRFRFRARDESSVSVNTVTSRVPDAGEVLASGTSTQTAITRTPVGSRTTLSAV